MKFADAVLNGYDGLDRMNWVYEGAGTSSALLQYGYDAAARPYYVSRVSGLNTTFNYSALQHLAALSNDFNGTAADVTYGLTDYNPAGQLFTTTRDNAAYAFNGYVDVSRAYVANGLNQYTSSGGVAIASDANGNLRASGAAGYTYDVENRLVAMTDTSGTASLSYDPLGRLYEVGKGAATRRFLYDGDELVAEYDASGTMLARYVHGSGNDDPMVWYNGATMDNSTRRFLHTDQQGSITAISDYAGNAIATNTYDEYGIPGNIPSTKVVTNTGTFQYTGQAYLAEIGLYYYKARIYSPTLGRFLQVDPIGYADQNNLYAYVGNDPIDRGDPSGKATTCSKGGTYCFTIDTGSKPKGGKPVVATNVNNGNRRTRDAKGTALTDLAARETAAKLNQSSGNERLYRMDQYPSEAGPIIMTSEVPTKNAGPSGATVIPSTLTGALAAFHTEPTAANTGLPGKGDYKIPDSLGIPNYAAYGSQVTAIEQSGGAVQIRPLNGSAPPGSKTQVKDYQDRDDD